MAQPSQDYPTFYRKLVFPHFRKRVMKISGIENVPTQGPYLVVSNHVGSFDPPMVVSVLNPIIKQLIYFVSEQFIVDIMGLRTAVMRLGMIPKIENRKAECLERARDLLNEGKIVGIFPEGMRNDGPVLLKGRTGAARLALWTKLFGKIPFLRMSFKYRLGLLVGVLSSKPRNRWFINKKE